MPSPNHRLPGIDYDAMLEEMNHGDEAPAPSTNDLLRELIDEVRGMRRDLRAFEWRRGISVVPESETAVDREVSVT
jgi:hypothetical protein